VAPSLAGAVPTATRRAPPQVEAGPGAPDAATIPPNTWVAYPLPTERGRGPLLAGSGAKHSRVAYDSRRRRLLWVGGDYGGGGDGNGQSAVWGSTSGSSWDLLAPFCIKAPAIQPARPDNVVWVYDSKRDRAIIMPGYFFGVKKAKAECRDSEPRHTALIFDLATNTWQEADWPKPPRGYGGDNASTFGIYDPAADAVIRYRYDGGWGGNMEVLSLESKTWKRVRLGENPRDRDIQASYAWRSQLALDVKGRAVYFVGRNGKLFRYLVDQERGETVADLPPEWRMPPNDAQEIYMVFDPGHRVLLIPDVYNLGGQVLGLAIFHVDQRRWEWEPVPTGGPHAVLGNVLGFEEHLGTMLLIGGHRTWAVDKGGRLPAPRVFWRYRYGPAPEGTATRPAG
jgi:hypothetical protein